MKRSTAIVLGSMGVAAVAFYAMTDNDRSTPAHVFRTVEDCVLSGGVQDQRCRSEYQDAVREHERTAPRYASRAECEQEFGPGNCGEQAPRRTDTRPVAPPTAPGTSASASAPVAPSAPPVFLPLMAGYMFGQLNAPRYVATQPLYSAQPCQPGQAPPPPGQPGCQPAQSSGGGGGAGGGGGGGGRSFRTSSNVLVYWGGPRSTVTVGAGGAQSTVTRPPATTSVPTTATRAPVSRPTTVARDGFGQTSRSVSLTSRSSGT